MEIVNRYKYFIIAGVVLCTIIVLIVYNVSQNSDETEYESKVFTFSIKSIKYSEVIDILNWLLY